MGKELTDGFDLKAKVSEGFLSDLFKRFTLEPVTKTVTWANQDYLLEVYFHLLSTRPPAFGPGPDIPETNPFPQLKLVPAEGNLSFVQLRFPFRAVIRKLGAVTVGWASVVLPAKTTLQYDPLSGGDTAVVSVDLSHLSAGQVDFAGGYAGLGEGQWGDRDALDDSKEFTFVLFRGYKTYFPPDLFEQEVEPLVIDALRTIEKIPITPQAKTTSLGYFTFRTYADESPFLGVFANTTASNTLPPAPLTFSMPPLQAYPPPGTNLHLLVPKDGVVPKLEAAKAEAVKKAKDEHGVDIEDFALELQDGYIRATGHAKDVDFEAHLGLYISNEILHVQELALNVDLPWWMDLLQIFPVSSIVVLAIRKAISDALHPGVVEDWTSTAFAGLGISSEELAEIPTQFKLKLLVDFVNDGTLTIRSNGVVIPGRASATLVTGPGKLPEYVYAHRRSKEFHRADCSKYHRELFRPNLVSFAGEKWAIHNGFNGCAFCYPDYHVDDLEYGYLKVRIQISEPTGPDLEAALRLDRVNQMTIHDLTVKPSLRLTAYKFIGMPLLDTPVAAVPLDVFAGKWKLRAERGSWSAQCEVEVPPRKDGKYVRVTFEVGSPECQVKKLDIPNDLPLAIGELRV